MRKKSKRKERTMEQFQKAVGEQNSKYSMCKKKNSIPPLEHNQEVERDKTGTLKLKLSTKKETVPQEEGKKALAKIISSQR